MMGFLLGGFNALSSIDSPMAALLADSRLEGWHFSISTPKVARAFVSQSRPQRN